MTQKNEFILKLAVSPFVWVGLSLASLAILIMIYLILAFFFAVGSGLIAGQNGIQFAEDFLNATKDTLSIIARYISMIIGIFLTYVFITEKGA